MDWNVISSIATTVAAIATAVGVGFAAWQIRLSKKQSQAEFEDGFDQQYRVLSMSLPVDVLIGKEISNSSVDEVRELIYNYLDLSNEQIYLRAKGRITRLTWMSWAAGIKQHMNRVGFKKIYNEVRSESHFTYLDRVMDESFGTDPVDWF